MRNYYKPGDWNADCDRCGLKFKASMLRREWTELMVCNRCYEARHPQTLIRVPEDNPSTPWSRPEPADVFIGFDPIITESDDFLYTEAFTILITES